MMNNTQNYIALNMLRYNELNRCLKEFSGNYALIKGEVLSKLAYGELGKRISGDIDILVSRKNLINIEKCLIDGGFYTTSSDFKKTKKTKYERIYALNCTHQLFPYVKTIRKVTIEVDTNFDIFWGEYSGKKIDIDEFLLDTVDIDIYDCKFKTLTPIKSFIQLILHHYKELNSIYILSKYNPFKVSMFQDVFFLFKRQINFISLKELILLCEKYQIVSYVYYILYFNFLLFPDNRLKKYVEAFETKEGILLLNCYGLTKEERREWKIDFFERLKLDKLNEIILKELDEKDLKKIKYNKKFFEGNL